VKHIHLMYAAGIASAFLSAAASAVTPDNAMVQRALGQLNSHANTARVSEGDSFVARDLIVDANGASHVRFDRSYNGLPVIGGDLVVHMNSKGNWKGVSQTLAHGVNLDTHAAVAKDSAIRIAEREFVGDRTDLSSATQVIYARGEYPVLAWDAVVVGVSKEGTESSMHFIIDGNSGLVLDQWDDVKTTAATGTGNSLFAGTVTLTTDLSSGSYVLRDPTRGSHYTCTMANKQFGACTTMTDTNNVWGTGATSNTQTAAVDATYGQNLTWDFYKASFNRNGIANDGKGAYSRVHYGTNYVNAYWSDSCFCMTYGDGDGTTYYPLVSLDVAGHEMTHGVTSRTAALTYSGESGGLNEAMSDIFGTLVEYYAANTKEVGNYLIGERLYISATGVTYPTKAFRYMHKPSIDGKSPDCYTSTIGNLDVHYSSGVANHFFYLLTQGAVTPTGFSQTPAQLVCNGNTSLAKITQAKAAQIMYRALTVYMTSSTNYAGARTATLKAATDLYGSTSAEYSAVAAAWSAVSVN
jgi:Zn-dependent metalloprotease